MSASRKWARVFIALGLIAAGVIVLRLLKNSGLFEKALHWLADQGPWAPLMFIAIYTVSVLLFVPASVLTLGAGIVFGFVKGALCVLTGAFISAALCFLIARYSARAWIARRFESNPKFRAIDDAVAREGWKIVTLVRLAPIFPFSVSNYGFGLTRVPLWQYLLASLAMIPGTSAYVYFGHLMGDVSGLRKGSAVPLWVKCAAGALALLAVFYLARFAKRALKHHLRE